MRYFWLLIVMIIAAVSLFFGSKTLNILNSANYDIVYNLRLPRVLFAFCIGSMLGLSGSVYQLVLRNPLADSFTTGAASSSALGAVLAISIGLPALYVPAAAMATGLAGLAIVYKLSGGAKGSVTMILCGIIINIVSSSIISFLKFFFDGSLTSVVFWLMGGFNVVDYKKLAFVAVVMVISYMYLVGKSSSLDMLAFDEATAGTSGINVKKERATAFFFATLLVAVAVSFSGMIGFVGLIVPHIARSISRPQMKYNLYYSAVFGGLLLMLADTLARSILSSGAEMPVGIITSVIGGVFFFYILVNRRGEIWHD